MSWLNFKDLFAGFYVHTAQAVKRLGSPNWSPVHLIKGPFIRCNLYHTILLYYYAEAKSVYFEADELLYEDYEKMSLISEIMFRKFLPQFKTKTALPPQQSLNTRTVLPGKHMSHHRFSFMILNVSSSISTVYVIRIGLIYEKLCSFKHCAPFYQIFLSVASHLIACYKTFVTKL